MNKRELKQLEKLSPEDLEANLRKYDDEIGTLREEQAQVQEVYDRVRAEGDIKEKLAGFSPAEIEALAKLAQQIDAKGIESVADFGNVE